MKKELLSTTCRLLWDTVLIGSLIGSGIAIYKSTNGFDFSEKRDRSNVVILNQSTNQYSQQRLLNSSTLGLF
jgi:hypothetical protein